MAQFWIGLMYIHGRGVRRDPETAFKWIQKAAEQGDREAQYHLGIMYYQGDGIAQNSNNAHDWYEKAAVQGHTEAQFNLALMYRDGVEADDQEALRLLKLAVEQKDGNAFYTLGWMYEQGRGVEKDKGKAEYYYNEGKKRFPLYAYYALGRMYELGLNIKVDLDQAKFFYQQAADLHHGGALERPRNLGGDGGQKKLERSPHDKGKERILLKEDQGDERDPLEEQQGKEMEEGETSNSN